MPYADHTEFRAYMKAYRRRSHVREQRANYEKEYRNRPEVKARKRTPEQKEKRRAYNQRPEVKARNNEHRRGRKDYLEKYMAELRQRPEHQEWMKQWKLRQGPLYSSWVNAKHRAKKFGFPFNITLEECNALYPQDGSADIAASSW
jgi:hypothetical protein